MQVKTQTLSRIIRWSVLSANVIFFMFLSSFISVHTICPIGGFELFFTGLFSTGLSIAGIFSGMVLHFIIMSVFSIIFRRAYCSYICPMGALQELFERIGKVILPKKIRNARIPKKIDFVMRWMKYFVLLSFIVLAGIIGGHWMISVDPFIILMTVFRTGLSAVYARNPVSVVFFFTILFFAFFLGRGFCKYLCPAGAWYAMLSKVSPARIVRDESLCVSCGKCSKACPMKIDVANLKKVTSGECLGCLECVNACPRNGALLYKMSSVTVPSFLVPLAAVAFFSGGVALAASKTPVRGSSGTQGREGRPDNGEMQTEKLSGVQSYHDTPSSVQHKVGFGGCSTCSGCGICAVMANSDKMS